MTAPGDLMFWFAGPDVVVPLYMLLTDNGTTATAGKFAGGGLITAPSAYFQDATQWLKMTAGASLPTGWSQSDLFWDSNSDQVYWIDRAFNTGPEPIFKVVTLIAVNRPGSPKDCSYYVSALGAPQGISKQNWHQMGIRGT